MKYIVGQGKEGPWSNKAQLPKEASHKKWQIGKQPTPYEAKSAQQNVQTNL